MYGLLRQRFLLSWSLGLLGAVLLGFVFIPSRAVTWVLDRLSWLDVTLAVLAIGLLLAAFIWRPMVRYTSAFPPGTRLMRIVSAWWIVAGLAAVLVTLWGTTAWMLGETTKMINPDERQLARIEAVRTGMQTAAGVAGGAALLLAFRRQRHQEAAAKGVEHDANERRVTELYLKAADQLGSDKAPVRLAGLYALERLGKANPEHRQTIVDILCAYLRMPLVSDEDLEFERQVRKTAQRILHAHLRWDRESEFWPNMRLDLDGATFTHHDFQALCVDYADFSHARFLAGADFWLARFEGSALFTGAQVHGHASFKLATFRESALFAGSDFQHTSTFTAAEFRGDATFEDARFAREPSFREAKVLASHDATVLRIWPAGVDFVPAPRQSGENWLTVG